MFEIQNLEITYPKIRTVFDNKKRPVLL